MNMRMYIYLDKNIIKQLAPKMSDISFDIDFFEYSEKRGYTTNNNKYTYAEPNHNIEVNSTSGGLSVYKK